MKHTILISVMLGVAAVSANAADTQAVAPADTLKINTIITGNRVAGGDAATLLVPIATEMIGLPYEDVVKTDPTGMPRPGLDGFDDMSFVNTVIALAKMSVAPYNCSWKELPDYLAKVGWRRGEANNYASRMVYGSDWIVDNRSRNVISELTENYSTLYRTKSLDYMSRHRDEIPALKDSARYEAVRMVEFGYRLHKIPHLKREAIESKEILPEVKDGDIIMLLGNDSDFDFYTMGFVVRRPDGLHLIHASKADGKVVEEPETLGRYIKRNVKKIYGVRWLRLKDD